MVQRPSAHQDSPQRAAEEPASDLAPRPRGPQVGSGVVAAIPKERLIPGAEAPLGPTCFGREGRAPSAKAGR